MAIGEADTRAAGSAPTPAADPTPPTGRTSVWRRMLNLQTFHSLRAHPNYRLYWCGALTSNIGTWMETVAQGWLVYQLTESAFMLGVVGFAQSVPFLAFALYGGVLADSFERRRLMVWTQSAMMVVAFALAALTFSGVVEAWHVLVLAFLRGIANAFNTPVRQSIVSDLVPKQDLANAIAINSMQFQSSRTLGPALAGVLLALVGPAWCFFLNGLSFVAVIWTLLAMDVPPLAPRARRSAWRSVRDGLAYVRADATIRLLLLVATIPGLFGMAYTFLLPAFAEGVLEAGATGLGVMQSAVGIGALAGALSVASLPRAWRGGTTLLVSLLVLGLGLQAFGLSRLYVLSVAMLFVVGFGQMVFNNLKMTFVQGMVADEMRGRVLSLFTLASFGLQPLGAVQAGALASLVGPGWAMLLNGSVCVALGLVVWARWPKVRALS